MQDLIERADKCIERLKELGVIDTKFELNMARVYEEGVTPMQILQDKIAVVEAILDGRTFPALPIGDSTRGHN